MSLLLHFVFTIATQELASIGDYDLKDKCFNLVRFMVASANVFPWADAPPVHALIYITSEETM